jgi:hypothetical protein
LEDEEDGRFNIKERWMNLAPVKDFVVVKEEGGGVVSQAMAALSLVAPCCCIGSI